MDETDRTPNNKKWSSSENLALAICLLQNCIYNIDNLQDLLGTVQDFDLQLL